MLNRSITGKRRYNELVSTSQLYRAPNKRKYNKSNNPIEIIQIENKEIPKPEDEDDADDDKNAKLKGLNLFGSGDETVYIKDNHIYFRDDVTSESINKLVRIIDDYNDKVKKNKKHMIHFDESKLVPKELYIHISSFGGSLFDCMIGYDSIKNSEIGINTVVEGFSASCGSLLSVAGKKRYMTKNSVILVHQLSSSSHGKFQELEDDYFNSKEFMERIINIYYDNCKNKMTKKEIKEYLKHDRWWNVDEAIKKGLVDEIYTGEK